MIRWIYVSLTTALLLTGVQALVAQTMNRSELLELLALDGNRNIMKEENFGIANGYITTRVNYNDLGTISALFAPPYASSDFLLECRLFGEKPATQTYRWYPFEVERTGEINGVEVKTWVTLLKDSRSLLISFRLRNTTEKSINLPIQFALAGSLDYVQKWEFQRPSSKTKTSVNVQGNRIIGSNEHGQIILLSDLPGLNWFELGARLDTRLDLPAGKESSFHIGIEMGGANLDAAILEQVMANPEKARLAAQDEYIDRVQELFSNLPHFQADNKALENYYYRSLAVLFTNKWKVPEFTLQPYYGSGGVIGGCLGNYLWEFGLPAQLFPLIDPEASKTHIKQFLKIDITRHYLFNPMDGAAGGVWYQVNQDKIIELIYYYVLHTGDIGFLQEKVEGRTIYDHVISNALFGDDLKKPVKLVDYGDAGENHLELRRGYPYRGIMPDINGLRYLSYQRAYELSKLANKPVNELPARAETLKGLLKQQLWSKPHQWFYFESNGKKDIRMTNFMFMLVGTGIFDKEVENGLMSHFNDREFLGDYGIHSISKLDPAYDQVDIDHGGGGSYVAFPPIICQRLYNAGYPAAADDLFQRHLWWGERLPYWGDSKVANYIGYREDTPLQSDFSAISGAQTILFGLFGIKILPNGQISILPVLPSFSKMVKLESLKIRGKQLDIKVDSNGFSVTVDGKTQQGKKGHPIIISTTK